MRAKFEEYYNKMAPKLTNYLVASGANYDTSCEIVQESFLKLWKIREQLIDDEHQVQGLLWTIARHLRVNQFRHEKRMVLDENAGVDQEAPQSQGIATDEQEILRCRIKEALDILPPLLREAYTLFHIGELSIREIARQTNVSEVLVRVRISRAKQKLQDQLADLRNQ